MKKTTSTAFAGFIATMGLLPVAAWLSGMLFAWRTSIFLGRWPTYGQPDPKSLPDSFDPMLPFYRSALWCVVILASTAITLFLHKTKHQELKIPIAALFSFLTFAMFFVLLFLDPRGMFEWIMD